MTLCETCIVKKDHSQGWVYCIYREVWLNKGYLHCKGYTRHLWKKARKKPVIIEYREVEGKEELIKTLEGDFIAHPETSFIIRGVEGEIYPIKRAIFFKTYDKIGVK